MPLGSSSASARLTWPLCSAAILAFALLIVGPAAHASDAAAGDRFKLRKITVATSFEDERLRSKDGSEPRRLLGVYPHVGVDARYDDFFFGGKAGPRKLTGLVGDGPAAFRVDAYGYRVSGYGSYMVVPGLLIGLGAAYQVDSGELDNAFGELNAELYGYEIQPQILAVLPYDDIELEFFLGAAFTDATLIVDGFPDERFKTEQAETGAEILAPLTDDISVMLGVEGRYTWRQDTVLGGQERDELSTLFEAGLDFRAPSDITVQFRFEARPFDSVANDKIYTLKLVKNF